MKSFIAVIVLFLIGCHDPDINKPADFSIATFDLCFKNGYYDTVTTQCRIITEISHRQPSVYIQDNQEDGTYSWNLLPYHSIMNDFSFVGDEGISVPYLTICVQRKINRHSLPDTACYNFQVIY